MIEAKNHLMLGVFLASAPSVTSMVCTTWMVLYLTYRLRSVRIKFILFGSGFQRRNLLRSHVNHHLLCCSHRFISNISLFSYLGFHPFVFDRHCVVVRMVLCLTFRADTHSVSPTVNLKPVRETVAVSNLYLTWKYQQPHVKRSPKS